MSQPVTSEVVTARGVEQVLHFTTSHGLVGIFVRRALLARQHLSTDNYLEHIYQPNASRRYEGTQYWRYVNLSVTTINERFFSISQGWHPTRDNLFWAILHFDAAILTHPDVLFATGNMAYAGVVPREGEPGFTAMFADRVVHGFGKYTDRTPQHLPSMPTDAQAEVLYPDSVDTTFLRQVTVSSDEHAASVEGIVGAVGHPDISVVSDPASFRP